MSVDSPQFELGAKERIFLSRAREYASTYQRGKMKIIIIGFVSGLVLIGVADLWAGRSEDLYKIFLLVVILVWPWDKARDVGKLIRIIDRQAAKIRTLNEA